MTNSTEDLLHNQKYRKMWIQWIRYQNRISTINKDKKRDNLEETANASPAQIVFLK
jgi:hypothetical protein